MSFEEINYDEISKDIDHQLEENNFNLNGIPMIYTSRGQLDIKFFINPLTPSIVTRQFHDHSFDDTKFPCLTNFEEKNEKGVWVNCVCPFCIEYADRGKLWKGDTQRIKKTYNLMYGVLMDYKLQPYDDAPTGTQTFKMPERGSVVVVMMPKGAYLKIMALVHGPMVRDVLKPQGKMVRIINDPSIPYNYDAKILPEDIDVTQTVNEITEKLVDLREFKYPREITPTITQKVETKTTEFKNILDRIIERKSNNGQDIKKEDKQVGTQTVIQGTTTSNPDCLGQYDSGKNKCLICTNEMVCIEKSKK